MEIIEKQIKVNDYVTKSNLPASDYVINPYVGCPHGCKYCYASFMKRFTGHKEDWGTFVDIKLCDKKININKLKNKRVFLSSVTDCYNKFEEKYELTRNILKQLVDVDCELYISTKSKLILRDMDLLKQMKNLIVSMSINTLDENFKNDMDNASSIQERLQTLKELHNNGIFTVGNDISEVETPEGQVPAEENASDKSETVKIENPKTSDNFPIYLMGVLASALASGICIRKLA